jgi:hypothetical protein
MKTYPAVERAFRLSGGSSERPSRETDQVMNSETGSSPAGSWFLPCEVSVGAPLCELMRRYSDAAGALTHARSDRRSGVLSGVAG